MFYVKSTRVNKREDNTLYIEQCFVFSDNPLLKTCLLYLPSDLSYFLPNCWHLASCLGTPPPWQASVRTHQQSVVVGQRSQYAHGSCLAQACCDLVGMLDPCQGPCLFICLFFSSSNFHIVDNICCPVRHKKLLVLGLQSPLEES